MHLLRCLAFSEANISFDLHPHLLINTRLKHLAADISRHRVSSFLSKVPQANPTYANTSLLATLLLNSQADWIWELWRRQFHGIFKTAYPPQRRNPMQLSPCTKLNVCHHHHHSQVTEHLFCCFAAYLVDQGLAPQTGSSYLAVVRSIQISLGLPDTKGFIFPPILKRVKRARLRGEQTHHKSGCL